MYSTPPRYRYTSTLYWATNSYGYSNTILKTLMPKNVSSKPVCIIFAHYNVMFSPDKNYTLWQMHYFPLSHISCAYKNDDNIIMVLYNRLQLNNRLRLWCERSPRYKKHCKRYQRFKKHWRRYQRCRRCYASCWSRQSLASPVQAPGWFLTSNNQECVRTLL